MYNLSYQEFLRFYALEDSDDSLLAFMRIGGLPGLKNLDINDEAQVRDYLQGVYSTVMFKDVMARQQIRNVPFMENMSHYLADNVGKIVSAGSIAGTMISQGQKITPGAVSDYLGFLRSALLVSKVFRFDVHGRKLLERNSKYFFSDHGIRNMLCGFDMRGSIERIMENVIYLHLRQQGFEVTVGILPRAEIDFVATRGEERIYVQSSYLLASQETVKREFGNLAAIQDNYPKYVVSMDPVSGNFAAYPGIRHMRLREFLTAAL